MNKKKKLHPVLKILLVLFIIYIALFIASSSGYYEGKVRDRVTLTESSIKEFEDKIASGETIDIDSYLNNEIVDYSNSFSKLGDEFTSGIQKVVEKSSKVVIDILKSLF